VKAGDKPNLKRKQGKAELSQGLAELLLPSQVRTGVSLSTVTGGLGLFDLEEIGDMFLRNVD
jgi:hypothetical protein